MLIRETSFPGRRRARHVLADGTGCPGVGRVGGGHAACSGVAAGCRGASVLERLGPVGSASIGGRRLCDESVVVTVRGGDL